MEPSVFLRSLALTSTITTSLPLAYAPSSHPSRARGAPRVGAAGRAPKRPGGAMPDESFRESGGQRSSALSLSPRSLTLLFFRGVRTPITSTRCVPCPSHRRQPPAACPGGWFAGGAYGERERARARASAAGGQRPRPHAAARRRPRSLRPPHSSHLRGRAGDAGSDARAPVRHSQAQALWRPLSATTLSRSFSRALILSGPSPPPPRPPRPLSWRCAAWKPPSRRRASRS